MLPAWRKVVTRIHENGIPTHVAVGKNAWTRPREKPCWSGWTEPPPLPISGDVSVIERDGNTIIRQDGQILMFIVGQTGLDIGLHHADESHAENAGYDTDLGGRVIAGTGLDVTLEIFEHFPA